VAILCISYELSEDGHQDFIGLSNEIKRLGRCCRPTHSTWLVSTDRTPSEVQDRVAPYLHRPEDKLVVLTVAVSAEWSLHGGKEDELTAVWMQDNIKAHPFASEGQEGTGPSWKHEDVFPIIAHIIVEAYRQEKRYIESKEIASGLLSHPEARPIIEAAQQSQQGKPTLYQVARNMVAWFTVRFTMSGWDNSFDSTEIDGEAAYKPKSSPGE
jgi:hypothetical protein